MVGDHGGAGGAGDGASRDAAGPGVAGNALARGDAGRRGDDQGPAAGAGGVSDVAQ